MSHFEMPTLDAISREGIFCHYARSIIQSEIDAFPQQRIHDRKTSSLKEDDIVGILGAGVGGLYAALMLQSLGIKYQIIEASERVGGRLFTHKFDHTEAGKYDYYDVGAMRFPLPKKDENDNYRPGIMRRLGDLFKYLGMEDSLLPYYYSSNASQGFNYFNGVRARVGDNNSFNAHALGISQRLSTVGVSKIVEDVVGPFVNMLMEDLVTSSNEGWKVMMRNDVYSMRGYMSLKYIPSTNLQLAPEHMGTRVVNWCESLGNSTGAYDRALSEIVLGTIAFGATDELKNLEWKCIDGGSSVLAENMKTFLEKNEKEDNQPDIVLFNKTVTAIYPESDLMDAPMVVKTSDGQTNKYARVISTLPTTVLRTIDLGQCKLDVLQSNALRELDYGPSIKIGILFTDAWWTTGKDKDGVPFNIVGGQSYSDLPIRTVVYPSYGTGTHIPEKDRSKTIIASYCWTSDAERLGSLIGTGKQKFEDQLKTLVLSNLAEIHNVTYEYLDQKFLQMHSWNWSADPYTMGASAYFGPGDFSAAYKTLTKPLVDGRLFLGGEALSIRHAWVVGALNSAWRTVYELLRLTDKKKIKLFMALWGVDNEWFQKDFETMLPSRPKKMPVLHGPAPIGDEELKYFEEYRKYSLLEDFIV